MKSQRDKILIVDFGSQYTQLIARRLRELGVYTEIASPENYTEEMSKQMPKGVILSGGPSSIEGHNFAFGLKEHPHETPLLGICFGMQLLNAEHKGTVRPLKQGEYGKQQISLDSRSALFHHLSSEESVWMSHGDSVEELSPNFKTIAKSRDGMVAAIEHRNFPFFGVQFHPEVTHTPNGEKLLRNFTEICGCQKDWSIENYIEQAVERIREQVGNSRVISLVSGGVDSTAATLLCHKALGPENVHALHINTGLMRACESEEVIEMLEQHGFTNLVFVDASQIFLTALQGVSSPEKKRQIIGDLFMEILDEEMKKIDALAGKTYLCQGTLYTDLIESGKGVGKHAKVIKSHHNVNPPFVEKKRREGLIIEPNDKIFKDEVRKVCEALEVPRHLTWRHPFPGPGLAIRIMGDVSRERITVLQKADRIYLDEIEQGGIYDEIWQAFAVLLPISTVGVMGDNRTEGHVIALRAVTSKDGMTAECYPFPFHLLERAANRIVNEIPSINRVVYDVTSKPPATIEWE